MAIGQSLEIIVNLKVNSQYPTFTQGDITTVTHEVLGEEWYVKGGMGEVGGGV